MWGRSSPVGGVCGKAYVANLHFWDALEASREDVLRRVVG
jgi:hypothetical protein